MLAQNSGETRGVARVQKMKRMGQLGSLFGVSVSSSRGGKGTYSRDGVERTLEIGSLYT